MQTASYDVLIAGGGMVGASLAVALSRLPLKIALVEAYPLNDSGQTAYDDRAIALSYGSSQILKGMGVWSSIEAAASAINSIHISDRGHFGATRLTAEQQKVPALGYLIQSRDYGEVLQQALIDSDVSLLQPASVSGLLNNHSEIEVSIQNNDDKLDVKQVTTKLLVACDGANSAIREMSGIESTVHDYQQVAIIANISTSKPHKNQAFERFTEQGPIALLPMSKNRSSLVWTLTVDNYQAILDLDDASFLKALGEAFGYRLGRFTKVGARSAFPLKLTTANNLIAPRVAIVGNAAHALHPVAGQGLNLALRDVADLAEQVAQALDNDQDIGSMSVLHEYAEQRQSDTQATVRYTDSLVKLFSNDNFLLGHARAVGLMAVDRLPLFRQLLAKQSMGLTHRKSRLSRGLPLLKEPLK
ncbi:2-octaprenyl-6-methoxyphenyl hydroxylase [Leucothrix arctica]|uniref:2-octaprenyl-6-methoxyphenyl hydroxylase n=1 Tax=Leucothrix arctica TaxID=1481894 RepID=A0A317C7F0_9GAMM|nr:2-octaprenyl-6-methoxyphenyl hydroxylase [Leucothrix arctica]PWQ94566.1 2-octaprenyl-6-methoxyphenyl hydroxylase [Leucothrix arctica]